MAADSRIEWTDATFNPWIGCTKVSPGCDHCYAEQQDKFRGWTPEGWGAGKPRRRTSPQLWKQPKKWNVEGFYECVDCGLRGTAQDMGREPRGPCSHGVTKQVRRRVFCASLADVFDNEVDPQWRRDLFDLIRATPSLDWLLLTKRIGNTLKMLPWASEGAPANMVAGGAVYPNVWIGATIVNQEEADRDIPKLLVTPARVRFLSMEPLLGPVDLPRAKAFGLHGFGQHAPGIDWVIAGGESGPKARPMHPDWARSLRDQCAAAGVPFLFKQWGEYHPSDQHDYVALGCSATPTAIRLDGSIEHRPFEAGWEIAEKRAAGMCRIGKKAAGRLLDDVTHSAFPESAAS